VNKVALAPCSTEVTNLLQAIHHVSIICSDYKISKHFYTEILGLSILRETYRAERDSYKLDLELNGVQIELFSFPKPPLRPSYPEARGLRHLAFSVDDLDTFVKHLEQHHVTVEPIRVDELTGKRFTFFSDPDALPLELYEL
jgi:glyoxylase I family protein